MANLIEVGAEVRRYDGAARHRGVRVLAADRPLLAEVWSTVDGQRAFMVMARPGTR